MIAAIAPITTPSVNWLAIAPEVTIGITAVLVVLARALLRRRPEVTPVAYAITAIGIITAAVLLVVQWNDVQDHGPTRTMAGMVRLDGFGVFLGIVVLIATTMAILVAVAYLRREDLEVPEYLAKLTGDAPVEVKPPSVNGTHAPAAS